MPGEILKGFGPPAACRIDRRLLAALNLLETLVGRDARRSAAPLAEEEPPRPGKFTRYPGAIARCRKQTEVVSWGRAKAFHQALGGA